MGESVQAKAMVPIRRVMDCPDGRRIRSFILRFTVRCLMARGCG
jgi:hypothetical protein